MAITVTKEGNRWIARMHPFDWQTKDVIKNAGFRFSGTEKLWYTQDEATARRLDPRTAVQAVAEANQAIDQSRAVAGVSNVPAPEGCRYLPYQLAGIAYAKAHKNVLIADEMGLGKTIQAIGVINDDPTINSVLVICPASLKINWAREMTKWLVRSREIAIANGTFPSAEVVIINYDILVKHRATIEQRHWDMLIVDECHYVKNQRAQRTKALFGFKRSNRATVVGGDITSERPDTNRYAEQPIKANRRIFLTGTPIVNRPSELWTLVQALDEHDLGKSFFSFMKRYTNAHHNGYGWDFTGAAHLEELQTRMRSKFMVRRLKADVLTELPAKRRQIITLPENGASEAIAAERAMFARQQVRIAALRAERDAATNDAAYEEAVRRLRSANQIAFAEMSQVRHDTAVAKIPHVIAHLQEVLEAEEKVVVFVHHHDVAHAIKAEFPSAAVVTGETPVGQRQLEVDRFQHDPDCKLFIGSIKAAGVGLTLTAAAHVVFAELDWVPGNVTQAEDRLHRIGQRNAVLVQHLVFDDSIDARMAHTIIEKQQVIDAALDNPTQRLEVPAPQPQPQQLERRHEEPVASDAAVPTYESIPF